MKSCPNCGSQNLRRNLRDDVGPLVECRNCGTIKAVKSTCGAQYVRDWPPGELFTCGLKSGHSGDHYGS